MEKKQIQQLGDELYTALSTGKTISPLTSRGFDISVVDAYHIQQRVLASRIESCRCISHSAACFG